jgi:hypothetical protein
MKSLEFDFTDRYGKKYAIVFYGNTGQILIELKNEIGYQYNFGRDLNKTIEFLIDTDIGNFNEDVKNFLIKVLRNMVFV